MSLSSKVFTLYRRALYLAKRIPDNRALALIEELQKGRRAHGPRGMYGPEGAPPQLAEKAVDDGLSRIRFLSSMLSVRIPGQEGKPGTRVYTVGQDGKVKEGASQADRSGTENGSPQVDSATLDRHRELVKRQHFMGSSRLR